MIRPLSLSLVLVGSFAQGQVMDSTYRPPYVQRHREITLLTGYDQGRYGFGELGVAYNIYGVAHHPYAFGCSAGSELRVDGDPLIGPKLGVWVAGGMAMGLQTIYYTDFSQGSLAIRPEIGIGLFKFKLTYGYNIRCSNTAMEGINTHVAGIVYCFRLKRLKGDDALE